MKIAVITFAGERLGYGTGHVMETLAIADAWTSKRSLDICFFVNNFKPAVNMIEEAGYSVCVYTDMPYQDEPFSGIPSLVKNWGSNANLISLPALLFEDLTVLTERINRTIVILDNDENQIVSSDALINYNIAQDKEFYQTQTGLNVFSGPEYAPLNRDILDKARLSHEFGFRNGDIVVSLGGTNPNRLALKVLMALKAAGINYGISIVLGRGTPKDMVGEIKAWIEQSSVDCNVYFGLPQREFFSLLAKSKAIISAPGNTLYEILYLGVPVAAIAENDLTFRVASKFENRKCCFNLGMGPDLTINQLAGKLSAFLSTQKQCQQKPGVIDGKGVERIIEISEKIALKDRK